MKLEPNAKGSASVRRKGGGSTDNLRSECGAPNLHIQDAKCVVMHNARTVIRPCLASGPFPSLARAPPGDRWWVAKHRDPTKQINAAHPHPHPHPRPHEALVTGGAARRPSHTCLGSLPGPRSYPAYAIYGCTAPDWRARRQRQRQKQKHRFAWTPGSGARDLEARNSRGLSCVCCKGSPQDVSL